jgi:hypothetical protein
MKNTFIYLKSDMYRIMFIDMLYTKYIEMKIKKAKKHGDAVKLVVASL